ncbi:MAG: hypothetical protein LAT62_13470, partial [Natronospirillum sp.]|uniref:hypothetical protein n=1 Tax=Natronospirillum sp. TaxID=2812955 RepID=UPI0025D0CD5E
QLAMALYYYSLAIDALVGVGAVLALLPVVDLTLMPVVYALSSLPFSVYLIRFLRRYRSLMSG